MEEVAVMEEQIKNKEYLLKVNNDKDNKIIEVSTFRDLKD